METEEKGLPKELCKATVRAGQAFANFVTTKHTVIWRRFTNPYYHHFRDVKLHILFKWALWKLLCYYSSLWLFTEVCQETRQCKWIAGMGSRKGVQPMTFYLRVFLVDRSFPPAQALPLLHIILPSLIGQFCLFPPLLLSFSIIPFLHQNLRMHTPYSSQSPTASLHKGINWQVH